jgi:hypothetical protein
MPSLSLQRVAIEIRSSTEAKIGGTRIVPAHQMQIAKANSLAWYSMCLTLKPSIKSALLELKRNIEEKLFRVWYTF